MQSHQIRIISQTNKTNRKLQNNFKIYFKIIYEYISAQQDKPFGTQLC